MGDVGAGALKGVLKIRVSITAKTGLYIGGSKENIEIGGIDNIVEKLKVFKPDWGDSEYYDVPYIPGSSLKGKLRSLLEWVEEPNTEQKEDKKVIALSYKGNPCQCGTCIVCKLFGVHQAKNIQEPVRMRIEDLYPTPDTIDLWERVLDSGYTEMKTENMINRIKGVAENPRHTERVIAGSEFEGCITIRLFHNDGNGEEFIKLLKKAFDMLEDDYLGGSGSRGYGRVKIKIRGFEYKKVEDGEYKKVEQEEVIEKVKDILGSYVEEKEGAKASC